MQGHDHVGWAEAVIRLLALCLFPLLLALPAAADCLDDIKAELAAIRLKLASGSVPPDVPPVVPPTVPPTTPPATVTVTSGPSCTYMGPYTINGRGTVYNVCACPSVAVQVTNVIPGAVLSWAKIPGTGTPTVPLGIVRASQNGLPVCGDGTSSPCPLGLGDRSITFTAGACTNLVVQVR
jgi:hypothetical protein